MYIIYIYVCVYFACYDSMLMYNVSSLVLNVLCVRVSREILMPM